MYQFHEEKKLSENIAISENVYVEFNIDRNMAIELCGVCTNNNVFNGKT